MHAEYPKQRVTAPRRNRGLTTALIAANRGSYAIGRQWLLLTNLISLPFAILPGLAAFLAATGHARLASPIYSAFAPFCHQRDDRSFHLAGEKFACCHRCTAIYSGLLVFGIVYVWLRPRLQPASILTATLLAAPAGVDVLTQFAGWQEGSLPVRVATGAMLAASAWWYLLPRLDRGFADIRERIEQRFIRLVAQGRARPLRHAPRAPAEES